MKYLRNLLTATLLIAVLYACDTPAEYEELESGLLFRKVEKGDTATAQPGEVMNVVMTHVLNGDSVLYESGTEDGYYVNPQTGLPPNLQEAFTQLCEGDSAQIKMSYAEYATMTGRPAGADSTAQVVWNIRVREIENEQVVVARIQAEQLEEERSVIEDYLVNNNLEAETTEDGISIVTLREGNGEYPEEGDVVKVNYTLRLLDGTVIDTSYKDVAEANSILNPQRNYAPFEITIGGGGVIQGWQMGIPEVDKGGKATLFIPSIYGYGARTGGPIPPNSILMFDVEVVDF